MLRVMPAEAPLRRAALVLAAAMSAASLVVLGPSAPKAQALPGPCSLPGGSYVCKLAAKGAQWASDNVPGVSAVGDAAGAVGSAVDFATDPLGYMEGKVRAGMKGMLDAFGQELTGQKPSTSKNGQPAEERR